MRGVTGGVTRRRRHGIVTVTVTGGCDLLLRPPPRSARPALVPCRALPLFGFRRLGEPLLTGLPRLARLFAEDGMIEPAVAAKDEAAERDVAQLPPARAGAGPAGQH